MSRWRMILAVLSPRWREPVPCEGCAAGGPQGPPLHT